MTIPHRSKIEKSSRFELCPPKMNLLLILLAFYFLGVAFQLPFVRISALVFLLFVSYILYIESEARYHHRCLRYHEEE
jgi:hypothetical protein